MQKIKKESGVTLIALVITIIVLALISVPVAIKTADIVETKDYTNFKEDIVSLNESISQLYDLSSSLEGIGPEYTGDTTFLTQKNVNDNSTYYIIDCDKLSADLKSKFNIELRELNNGKNNYNVSSSNTSVNDVYVINAQSRTIYYSDGIEYQGYTIYRNPERYTKINVE